MAGAAVARLGLRAVKEVRVQFCPFENNVESTRYWAKGEGTGKDALLSRRGPRALRPGAHAALPPQDLPPGGEPRQGPRHQLEMLGDCGRAARRLRTPRGCALRWARRGSRAGRAAGSPHPLGPVILLPPDSFASSPGDGHRLVMRGAHLTAQEMLMAFASHIRARSAAGSGDTPGADGGR